MLRVLGGALLTLASAATVASAAETHLVIVTGLGGEASYRERFHEWAMSMREAAIGRYGLSPERVYYLAEKPEMAPDAIYAKSTKENIEALFRELQSEVGPGDQLYILLIGHGSFDADVSRFNLPGPDITDADFGALLEPFSEQQIVFVNTSSASGGFVSSLSGPNRILVTATKTGFERNEAQFGRYFVEAYAGEEADTDKNERVSVLEAFTHARLRVDGYYEEENILKTEHAIIDDDGDGQGSTDPGESEGDFAGSAYLMGASATAAGPGAVDVASDPELARLVESQQELQSRVEELRLQKDSMPEELYMQELERLLLELARVTQSIEERTNK
jgi:hypothetical protein